ncbi:TetR family transcriptional regulator [Actinomadura sp. NBRC 104412]|uniref:TetR/AcrR family transcriptional regulator n=1 Tax=Actinomadura sp. NBRC 104412 TaxID=3032203 RepID=UPI0024A4F241|nr:TetR/AcrR family transcriptional regulator [Actinomadura sp. NBRC 104412]GLZ08827.1 TetR family transcriptional regulator [Actinomadura sp. NBRC 104412]
MGLTRAERRRRSRERILAAARTLFAARGYERTTIRAVAAEAGVDPSLVIQHFGSKQELFGRAVRMPEVPAPGVEPGELVDHILATLGLKLGELPPQTLAMMRSMLTHPEAADSVRKNLGRQIEGITAAISGDDPMLRASLAMCLMLGVTIGHQLIELPPLGEASAEDIARLLRPALRALLEDGSQDPRSGR